MFVQTHIDWLKGHGVDVQPLDYAVAGGRGPLNQKLLESLPPDLAEWYAARLCDRVDALDCFAFSWFAADFLDFDDPPDAPGMPLQVLHDRHRSVSEPGGRPVMFHEDLKRGVAIAGWHHGVIVAETVGDRSGWLYGFDEYGEGDGPFMRSLPDYLACIRALVDNGFLKLRGYPDWDGAYERGEAGIAAPPADTPAAITSIFPLAEPFGKIVSKWSGVRPVPIRGSIVDLVPGLKLCPAPRRAD